MAICYREQGQTALEALELYEQEVKARQAKTSKDINTVFTTLKKSASNASSTSSQLLQNLNKMKTKTPSVKTPTRTAAKRTKTITKCQPAKAKTTAPLEKNVKQVTKAATKATKAIKAKKVKTTKRKEANLKKESPKLRRERVPETNFLLREFSWSSWKPAFSGICHSNNWVKRQPGIGYRNDSLFKPKRDGTALYEFSVSVSPGFKKIVVYRMYSTKEGLINNIERHLRSKHIKSRLHRILRQGCIVYVRRLALNKNNAHRVIDGATKLYSYLWDPDCTREFVKDDVDM